jgi:hypothetical protein
MDEEQLTGTIQAVQLVTEGKALQPADPAAAVRLFRRAAEPMWGL